MSDYQYIAIIAWLYAFGCVTSLALISEHAAKNLLGVIAISICWPVLVPFATFCVLLKSDAGGEGK